MSRVLFAPQFVLLALAPAALAGSFHAPHGFNVETRPGPGPQLLQLADGTSLVLTGFSDISRRLGDGTLIPFATGFGSIVGAAQSPVTGDIVVGDSFGAAALRLLHDGNGDLDCLDAGENVAHSVALPVLSNGYAPLPYDLCFRPGTDELYVTGSTPFTVDPLLGVVVRIASGTATVFADGFGYAGGAQWSGDTLFVADLDTSYIGHVRACRDANADGDALDAGESTVFADNLSGANDLVVAQDGTIYLSGLYGPPTFSGSVGRLLPDSDHDGVSDGVDEGYISGFGFSTGLSLSEGAGGFVPGVGGDGLLVADDYYVSGDVLVRTAPLAGTELSGTVANNHAFTLRVTGEPGAGALLAISLDQVGITLAGLGDLGLGFSAPHLILVLPALDGGGDASTTIALHNQPALVGTAFTAQGFTLQGGEIGIGDALDLVVGS